MPLHDPTKATSPATAGVCASQPPASNCQIGSLGTSKAATANDATALLFSIVLLQSAGHGSLIRIATITPDTKVSAPTNTMAGRRPKASARAPATTAPTAYPMSRQNR